MMSRWDDPQDDKYVGLKDWQLELLFFLIMGAAVVAFFRFDGVGAVKGIIDDESSLHRAAVAVTATPVASSVVRAPSSSSSEASDSPSTPAAHPSRRR
jgi:hypothetical protein